MKILAEATALADAANKASRIAPNKGAAYDLAAGIVLSGTDKGRLIMKATDLDVTFRHEMNATIEGEGTWRLPSSLLSGILSGLPMRDEVSLVEKTDGRIEITHGESRSTINQITGVYPAIEPFDPAGLVTVDDFARRAAQVTWACHKDSAPLTGVHIDGEVLVACDRQQLAVVPCVVPVENPITVPLSTLTTLLKNAGTVKLGAVEKRLRLMPDADTQITAIIYAPQPAFIPYKKVMRNSEDSEQPGPNFAASVDRQCLIDAITRMLVLVKGERYPAIRVTFEETKLGLHMQVPEVGLMEDAIPVGPVDGAEAPEKPFAMWLTPQFVMEALEAPQSMTLTLGYGPTDLHSLVVTDGAGYQAYVMPRKIT